MKNTRDVIIMDIAAIVVTAIFFLVPFVFIFLIASKPLAEANLLEFSWPRTSSCSTTWRRPSRPATT